MLHVTSLCALRTACKGLCTLAGWDWADFLETAARRGLIRRDPRDDEPTMVRDETDQPV
ncbi:hypothetical protein F2Q68_00011523 [Brassica cretica]|uniref:Uncharacterized protein n=1 Tax=Brassica cretica TaxID=69181 RepID=A0A8S9KX42_BRACR|nr:hypothetical protein F2Q68_00011523 [Brassica cretica]